MVAELKAEIETARSQAEGKESGGSIVSEAVDWREAIAVEKARGDEPVMADLITDRAYELEEKHGTAVATAFVEVATGKAQTPPAPTMPPTWPSSTPRPAQRPTTSGLLAS